MKFRCKIAGNNDNNRKVQRQKNDGVIVKLLPSANFYLHRSISFMMYYIPVKFRQHSLCRSKVI